MKSNSNFKFLWVNDKPLGLFGLRQSLLGLITGECFSPRIVPLVFVFSRESKWQLHSFACVGLIDAVFCDEKGRVVEVLEGWRPNGSYKAECAFKFLLEMPSGWILKRDLKLNNEISGII